MRTKLPLAVVDYGLGNLHSLSRALRGVGAADFAVSADPAVLDSAERLILPGVGAFGDGMAGLRERGLVQPLRAYAASGRPLLGICLGMQLLFEESEEFGRHEGLGVLPGRAVPLPRPEGSALKRTHIGWSPLSRPGGRAWDGTPLEGAHEGSQFYFVHSYVAAPRETSDVLALAPYGDASFPAVVGRGRVFGCQFHPEKSAAPGLRLLAAFAGATQETPR